MTEYQESDTVFDFLYESDDEGNAEELVKLLENDSVFERNNYFSESVYDANGSRVFVYPKSGYVRLLQKEGEYPEINHPFDIGDSFSLKNRAIRKQGETVELENF